MSTNYRPEIFKGDDGQWYWRLRAIHNGQVVASGAEGYTRKSSAKRAVVKQGHGDPVEVPK